MGVRVVVVLVMANVLALLYVVFMSFFFFFFWFFVFFFFNDTATTEIYTLSLHDVFRSYILDIHLIRLATRFLWVDHLHTGKLSGLAFAGRRSEEHTSELQSLVNLVCRLLLEKKKTSQYGR